MNSENHPGQAVLRRIHLRIDLPYATLNLRFNPFGELDREQLIDTAMPRCDFDYLVEHLREEHTAVQFMGPAGSGKSTHLLCLANRYPEFTYVHLPEHEKRVVPVCEDLMIDEAQRLGLRQRHRLWRGARRMVLGTHVCLQKSLRASGFRVRTIQLDQAPTTEWLQQTINRKISAARRHAGDIPYIDRGQAVRLLHKFGNNVRALNHYLYERFQQYAQCPQCPQCPQGAAGAEPPGTRELFD